MLLCCLCAQCNAPYDAMGSLIMCQVLDRQLCQQCLQAVNRPVLRLQTLLRIIHGIDSTRSSLLAELASALSQGSWQQQQQNMQNDSYKVFQSLSEFTQSPT